MGSNAFPSEGYFFLKSQKNGHVLDINGEDEAGSKLIIKPQGEDHELDNQLWTFENGYLVSKKTSFVMDIEGGDLRSDKKVLQYSRKKTMAHNQRWGIRDGFIYAVADPSLVLECQDNDDDVRVNRKTNDKEHQQWYIELYEGDY